MAWDQANSRALLFGGIDAGQKFLGDTWGWNGSRWEQIADFGPSPRAATGMTSMGAQITLFGGVFVSGDPAVTHALGDTWEFDGSRWLQRQDIGPSARSNHSMVFDSARNRVVLFGGAAVVPAGSGALGDTWEHAEDAAPTQPPATTISVSSLQLSPNPIGAGQSLTVSVTLSAPARPTAGQLNVTVTATDLLTPFVIPIDPDASTGSTTVPLSPTALHGSFTFSAQIAATPPVTAVLKVQ
jgi:hypothetical protein